MTSMRLGFSGSYRPDDVRFLLVPVDLQPTDVATKERLIQSGQKHYSELLAPEYAPDPTYLALFEAAFERNADRVARDTLALARALAAEADAGQPPVIVSLARAGTPVGALLRRALRHLGHDIPHYSVSIIRDRGIDAVALDAIRTWHPGHVMRFVDGWTGKGAIARELRLALATYDDARGTQSDPRPVVLSDLAGVAGLAAGGDDYLIPSAILNGTISGLLSRTVLDRDLLGSEDFHGCVELDHLAVHDRTRWYVDAVDARMTSMLEGARPSDAIPDGSRHHTYTTQMASWTDDDRAACRIRSEALMAAVAERFGIVDRHRIKPGIGEATRAVLRRMPERVLVCDPDAPDARHLVHLATQKGAPVDVWPDLPYAAVTLIRKLGSAHAPWRNPG